MKAHFGPAFLAVAGVSIRSRGRMAGFEAHSAEVEMSVLDLRSRRRDAEVGSPTLVLAAAPPENGHQRLPGDTSRSRVHVEAVGPCEAEKAHVEAPRKVHREAGGGPYGDDEGDARR